MSSDQSLNQDGEGQVFPSAELIAAREQEGLSLKDVAHELRLSEKYIESIERAAFEELPSLVFARGYIRSYTKLLKLDEERFLAYFDAMYGRSKSAPNIRSALGMQSSARLSDPMIKWSTWIFLLMIVAATVWWWKTQQGVDQSLSQLPAAQSVEVESADGTTLIVQPVIVDSAVDSSVEQVGGDGQVVGEAEALSAGEISIPLTVTETVLVDAEVSAVVAEQSVEPEPAEEARDRQVGSIEGTLSITFVDECWVSVEDSAGEVLAMRVKPAGSELKVSGVTPLKVLLGRASAVGEVVFDGEPVKFDRNIRSGVVRLNLPQS